MKYLLSFFVAAAGAAGLLLAGCGSDGSAGTGGGSSSTAGTGGEGVATLAAYCDATAGPFCEAYFQCCADQDLLMFRGGTLEECKRLYSYGGDRCYFTPALAKKYGEWIENGSTVFDQATFDACLAHLKAMSAGGAACVEPAEGYLNTVCRSAFQGQLAPGDTCVGVPFDIMSSSDPQCKDGTCDPTKHQCISLPKAGEGCFTWPACDWLKQTVCVDPIHEAYVCTQLGDIGEPCNPQVWDCKSLHCDAATNTCALPDPMTDACRAW